MFAVVVSNSAGKASSNTATLTVSAAPAASVAPSITSQPDNQSVVTGSSATFSVTATGSAPLTYQWKKNDTDISGATSSMYTTPATSMEDSGAVFAVVVSNSAGKASSNTATLTVSAAPVAPVAPSITSQPDNQSVVTGSSATFTVTATGSAPLTYQWKKNDTDIAGATSSTYTTPATSLGDNSAVFTAVVSNSAGAVTSSKATLTVSAAPVAPAIGTQPADQSVVAPQAATFSVLATGTGPLTYQWKKNGSVITGATSRTYTTPATAIADNSAVFTVVVTNSLGTVTSHPASLAVTAAPAIGTQPAAQTVVENQTASFSVTATGTAPLVYQWKKDGSDISGATASTYTTPATVSTDNNAVFTVVVSNSLGSVTSNPATLTISARFSLVPNGGSTYAATECVKDNSTGLVWEGKTASPATSRLGTSTYTNYDNINSAQKWNGTTASNPTQGEVDASTNSIGYRDSVRASSLCGFTDWRIPTIDELSGLRGTLAAPLRDSTWFPNTQLAEYWTSSPTDVSVEVLRSTKYVNFGNGITKVGYTFRYQTVAVRLVRGTSQ